MPASSSSNSEVSADEVRYGVVNPLEDRCGPVRERGSYENKTRHGDQVSYYLGSTGGRAWVLLLCYIVILALSLVLCSYLV